MARNAPGALRAPRPHHPDDRPRPIDGMSARANAAVQQLERQRPGLGRIRDALIEYRTEIRRPRRWLDLCALHSCPDCDFLDRRDTLEAALRALPPSAARELRRIVAVLDDEFLRKTLPDPHAASLSPWRAQAWWRQRIENP